MERNNNPDVVVMAKEMYEELRAMARSGMAYNVDRIDRHVRKFNPRRQPEHQYNVKAMEVTRSLAQRKCRELLAKYHGEMVYGKVKVFANTNLNNNPPLLPLSILRIGKPRWTLVTSPFYKLDNQHLKEKPISPDNILTTRPEGYIQGVGDYKDYLVYEGSIYDTREREAKKTATWLRSMSRIEG